MLLVWMKKPHQLTPRSKAKRGGEGSDTASRTLSIEKFVNEQWSRSLWRCGLRRLVSSATVAAEQAALALWTILGARMSFDNAVRTSRDSKRSTAKEA